MTRKRSERPSHEEAFAKGEASVRMEGFAPSDPNYEEVRARVLAGDVEPDQAVAELNKLRAREAGRRLIALGGTMPDLERIPRRRDIAKDLHDRKAEDSAERSAAMDVIHPPADILDRIVKGGANLH